MLHLCFETHEVCWEWQLQWHPGHKMMREACSRRCSSTHGWWGLYFIQGGPTPTIGGMATPPCPAPCPRRGGSRGGLVARHQCPLLFLRVGKRETRSTQYTPKPHAQARRDQDANSHQHPPAPARPSLPTTTAPTLLREAATEAAALGAPRCTQRCR